VTATARSRFAVIFFTILIDLIGFGIIIPILPYYAQRLGAGGFGLGALLAVFSGMQFLATAFLGRTSDRVGRRPILLTTMLINAVGYVLFAAAHSTPSCSSRGLCRDLRAATSPRLRPTWRTSRRRRSALAAWGSSAPPSV